ncbi:C40 family peptidase [Hugenholtzia roseola]|uniref:C40 family peptidase n=1 Tax=Hugenholtzia roseola TaxID=1002 RepID=UPI0003FB6CB6|nr:C40 family peptidase [Hugenholtzia roseola]
MDFEGIEFVKNAKGETVKVVIDLTRHRKLFDDVFRAYMHEAQHQKANPVGSSAKPNVGNANPNPATAAIGKVAQNVLSEARKFLGTTYRTGGTTPAGMDCSGLTMVAFKNSGISLPRSSRDQAQVGQHIDINAVREGDLVFFATGSDPNRISHVGIISKAGDSLDDLMFVHASTSRGVVEEQLFRLDYWKKAFRHARRVIV